MIGHSRHFVPAIPDADVTELSFKDDGSPVEWWGNEVWNLLAAVRQAAAVGLDVHAWQLPHSMLYFFRLSGRIKDWIDAYGVALGSARKVGDQQAEGHLLHELGLAHYDRKEPGAALEWTETSLSVFRELDDQAGELAVITSLGPQAVDAGRADEAEPYLRRGLDLLGTDSNSDYVRGQLHNGLGLLYVHLA